jgi:hypothetical protein
LFFHKNISFLFIWFADRIEGNLELWVVVLELRDIHFGEFAKIGMERVRFRLGVTRIGGLGGRGGYLFIPLVGVRTVVVTDP